MYMKPTNGCRRGAFTSLFFLIYLLELISFTLFFPIHLTPSSLPQFPGRPGPFGCQGIPAHRAGHPEDPRQDHWHRRGSLLLQEPELQVRMSGGPVAAVAWWWL